jgi:FkbM family methyltransferase
MRRTSRIRSIAEQLLLGVLQLLARSANGRKLTRLGSGHFGWWVPEDALVPGAVAYCGGAGEDISFDEALAERGLRVRTFDPTPRAIEFVESRQVAGDFRFLPIGWWDEETKLRFYAPRNPLHVSHSALNLQSTSDYFDASVDTVAALAWKLGDDRIDVLKMDIEGAEHRVIRSVLRSELRPAVLCVEFDRRRGVPATLYRLHSAGYRIAKVEQWNVTFVRR